MILKNVFPGVELDANGEILTDRTSVVPEAIKRSILANRARAQRHQPAPTIPAAVPERGVLAVLSGTAVSFDASGCDVLQREGFSQRERFAPDAFDASLAAGQQYMDVGHDGIELNGAFERIVNDGGSLKWRYTLRDGTRERQVLEQIRSGLLRGCSIAFTPQEQRFCGHGGTMIEHTLCKLHAISLTGTPQWYGTRIAVVSR